MSGCAGDGVCPECGGIMQTYSDYKPHDYVSGDCLECGFSYYTHTTQLGLEEVNELRQEMDWEPLKELRKKERRI